MDLGEVHAQDRAPGFARVKRRSVWLARPAPGGRKLVRRCRGALLQPLQDRLGLPVTGCDLGLIDVVKLNTLRQGEDVLFAEVSHQRLPHRLDRRVAPRAAVRGEDNRIPLTRHQRPG
jgi:hypothetical protein